MTEGLSPTGRFRYIWKGDEYYIIDPQTSREFHLGLVMNYQVATELALNACRVLEGLVAYDPNDAHTKTNLVIGMREIWEHLPCPRVCKGCNMEGHDGGTGYFYLACYLKSRIEMLTGVSG